MTQQQLRINHVQKTYDKTVRVLNDINLDVDKKEFIVLVGPSGCGKSTLLRIIAGLESVSQGSIEIAGRDVTELPPASRDIAMVFQDYALYPHMTVKENLAFGLKMRKTPSEQIEQELARAAKILDIEHLLERKPSQLSGGQRQRVAIGRAIVRRAALFLFDEPLSNLDAKLRAQTRIELADLHQQIGATSIYVTHDQIEAMTLADRIVVLNQGDIQQVGSPLELYNKPANKFVASFIGSPNMNFFEGELKFVEGKARFFFDGLDIDVSQSEHPKTAGSYTLGLRPESIKVVVDEKTRVDADLSVIFREPHGHESHMVGTIGKTQVIIRSANPQRLAVMTAAKRGEKLHTNFDIMAFHWFEPNQIGKRIEDTHPGEAS